MKKQPTILPVLTLCAAAILVVAVPSRAQSNTNMPAAPIPPAALTPPPAAAPPAVATPPAATPKPAARKRATPSTQPFRGTVTALDTNAMTLTVGQRTFEITSETMITKGDKPAILSDGAVGEPVRGAYKKSTGGKLDATTIRFGGAVESVKKKSTGK